MAKRILLSGSIAGHPVGYGGNTWAFLQWLLGFRRLGFDVYYVEERRAQECMDEALSRNRGAVPGSRAGRLREACDAAREFAREYLDSDRVLARVLTLARL